jgi:hypothetical protein
MGSERQVLLIKLYNRLDQFLNRQHPMELFYSEQRKACDYALSFIIMYRDAMQAIPDEVSSSNSHSEVFEYTYGDGLQAIIDWCREHMPQVLTMDGVGI